MNKTYKLTDKEVSAAIKWKRRHLEKCKDIGATFLIAFDPTAAQYSFAFCSSCKSFGCLDPENTCQPYQSERTFDETIFLGAGSHSILRCDILHQRLDYAIMQLGGEQQNGGMGTEYREEEAVEAKSAIDDVIMDVIVALGAEDRFQRKAV